jgi:hypothetical protein
MLVMELTMTPGIDNQNKECGQNKKFLGITLLTTSRTLDGRHQEQQQDNDLHHGRNRLRNTVDSQRLLMMRALSMDDCVQT